MNDTQTAVLIVQAKQAMRVGMLEAAGAARRVSEMPGVEFLTGREALALFSDILTTTVNES